MSTTVSFIVPAFNEADNIFPFYEQFSNVFDYAKIDYQLIFIDDGSTDDTRVMLKKLAAEKPHVLAISFSRNFGKEAAIWAGLKNASGEIIGIIDADLQQSPSDALQMVLRLINDSEIDIVSAYQEVRHENLVLSFLKGCFYKIMDSFMDTSVPANASDFRVFRRVVADATFSMPEYPRFFKGIFSWVGFHESLSPS